VFDKEILRKDIIASTVVEDVGSLILLAVILQTVNQTAILPIYLYILSIESGWFKS